MTKLFIASVFIIITFRSECLFAFRTAAPDSSQADKYYQKADMFWKNVKYDSSNFYYNKAAELYEKSDNWKKYIDCRKNMGTNFRYKGNYNEAFDNLNKALNSLAYIEGNNDSLRAELYNSFGSIYYEMGKYDKAFKYYKDMLDINEKLFGTDHTNTGKGYHNVGLIYYRTGDYEKALEYFEKALSIWDKTLDKNNPYFANCYTNISNIYYMEENYSKSIEYDEKALNIWIGKLGESHPYVAMSYNNLATTYMQNGDYQKALQYNYKSMQIRRDYAGEESKDVAFSYANIGDVFNRMKNFNNSEYFINKSISIYKKVAPKDPGLADAYIIAGNLFKSKSDFISSVACYDSALSVVWPGYNQDSINIALLDKMPSENSLVIALTEKGNALTSQYNVNSDIEALRKSLTSYKIASDVIEKLKQGFGREESKLLITRNSYEVNRKGVIAALELYAKTGDSKFVEKGFVFTERNKAGILAESIAEADARKFAGLPDSLIQQEKDIKADLSFNETKFETAEEENDSASINEYKELLFDSRQKYDSLTSYLEQNFPAYHNLKHPHRINSTDDIRKLLPVDAALVEYSVADTSISIFVLTNGSANAATIKVDSSFFDLVRKFRTALPKLNFVNYLSSSYELYSFLIAPVKKFISGKNKLYIIPDEIFAYLPFEALLSKDYSSRFNGRFEKLDYLINDYTISYHYSAELLQETLMHKNNNLQTSFAGFAPVFSSDKKELDKIATLMDSNFVLTPSLRSAEISGKIYSSLPETKTEVDEIGKLFKDDDYNSDIYLNRNATEDMLKSNNMDKYKFVHLATHGFINEEHPKLSGLIFYSADDSSNDGILYEDEIYNLNLNADLLVLSACESGLGKIVKGEGIYSLTRAFLYAGADNIVVSLWQVADKSTSILMIDFYKNILDGMDYSSALRKAKLDMIDSEEYSYPLEWSPFILVGH
jgi:CHAT domain-containing protein/lipopolysaccharide biosynthesis regulator YciM